MIKLFILLLIWRIGWKWCEKIELRRNPSFGFIIQLNRPAFIFGLKNNNFNPILHIWSKIKQFDQFIIVLYYKKLEFFTPFLIFGDQSLFSDTGIRNWYLYPYDEHTLRNMDTCIRNWYMYSYDEPSVRCIEPAS